MIKKITNKFFWYKNKKNINCESGFSLVEMLIYIFLITALTVVVVNSLVFMSKNYYALSGEKNIALSASTFLNRFSYEVRQATNFSISSSSLTLTGGDSGSMVFATSTSRQLVLNGNSLSIPGVGISKLLFKPLKTSVSQGINVQATFTTGSGSTARSQNFQLTTMLRNN